MVVAKDGVIETTDELLSQVEHFQGVIKSFFDQPVPDACEALIYRCDVANRAGSYLSAFERYAARLLRNAEAPSLRRIFSRHEIGVGRLSVTGLCWMSYDADVLSDDERRVVLACESVINRLILLFKSSLDAEGIAALSANDGERYCMERDWKLFSSLGREVDVFSASMQDENPLQIQFGIAAPKGGEWDTRTRFARMMESIVSPSRIEYRFDCQVDRGLFEVHVSTIPASFVPPQREGDTLKLFTDSSAAGQKIALSYALRLSAFVAAAAFFSNVAISHVVVTAHRGGITREALTSLYFERMPFLLNAVPALKLGDLSSEPCVSDPLACARALSPTDSRFACDEEGRFVAIEPLQIDFDERRPPIWQDDRAVPLSLRGTLHADVMSELDVMRIEDAAQSKRVTEAALDADSYPMASLAVFEDVLSDLSASEEEALLAEHPGTDGDVGVKEACGGANGEDDVLSGLFACSGESAGEAREGEAESSGVLPHAAPAPLYCQDEVSRVLVGLVDRSDSRFSKCPDCLFVANQKAAKINADLGDDEAARSLYQRGVDLAPTSPSAYIDLAYYELEKGSPDAAVNLLSKALLFSFRPLVVEYVYYRLAYALYRASRVDACIAAYSVVIARSGRFAKQAMGELKQVMGFTGKTTVPPYEEALEFLRKEEIPEAPSSFVSEQVVRALFGLVEGGFPKFSAALCSALSEASRGSDRDILDAVATSLSLGVDFESPKIQTKEQ